MDRMIDRRAPAIPLRRRRDIGSERISVPAKRTLGRGFLVLIATLGLCLASVRLDANPPADSPATPADSFPSPAERAETLRRAALFHKEIDAPGIKGYSRASARRRAIEQADRNARTGNRPSPQLTRQLATLTRTGTARILVVLVEFAGTDSFSFSPGESTWDPIGKCDPTEYTGNPGDLGTPAATSIILSRYGITTDRTFTYTGPLHNQIPRPVSESDPSGTTIWCPDFNSQYYNDLIFGNGVRLQYTRTDNSVVDQDLRGKSVRLYYEDQSAGRFSIAGEVVGWLQLPHSVWWYGADPAPGARSGASVDPSGGIPGAGDAQSLVRDAIDALNAAHPDFDWASYDQDGDGLIDHLWIIHAGMGEEDASALLNRTDYGEGGMWSLSSTLSPAYPVSSGSGQPALRVGPYIMMPENCGISVLAHEFAHSLGAIDLYAYVEGQPSTGFWTLMADDWTGYPLGFVPPALDPWHLDNWGWLDPYVVTDPTVPHTLTLGQASDFPGGQKTYRGVRIPLPDQIADPFPVAPNGSYFWWGGQQNLQNAAMTMTTPIAIPSADTNLTFQAAWDIETHWDFLWVQASADGGTTWQTLTNAHTSTSHDPDWIGGINGFPDDLAAAGIGGFSGKSANYPLLQTENFSLSQFAGNSIYLRFWYMTDWATLGEGPFLDDITITSGTVTLFTDDAETSDTRWLYTAPWARSGARRTYSHDFYLQWRNVSATGGYDSALGTPAWRFGPANTGLLVWYDNDRYEDNEVFTHLLDKPGFGPKGKMLVVDAHPEPYRDPFWVDIGYPNEAANLNSRSLMRDAPFSLLKAVDFTMQTTMNPATHFTGYPAVPIFSDSLGYYPGAEYVPLGPGYQPPQSGWVTKQWDGSVVMPSTASYGIRAPGYKNELLNFDCWPIVGGMNDGHLAGFAVGIGLGYYGGTGNPKEVDGQYGWNVVILSQTDQTATIQIWNSRYVVNPTNLWMLR